MHAGELAQQRVERAAGAAVGVRDEHRPARVDRRLQERPQRGRDRVGPVVQVRGQVLDVDVRSEPVGVEDRAEVAG